MADERASFYAWETVALKITLDDPSELTGYDTVCVSISQEYRHRELKVDISEGLDIDTGTGVIICYLGQTDTARFREGEATIQVNIYFTDHERDTSDKAIIDVKDNLLKEVMS